MNGGSEVALSVRDLFVRFGTANVLKGVNFDVGKGEILGFVGASGAGKSVLLRTMIGLIQPRSGTIEVFGHESTNADVAEHKVIERHWGILFQQGALFSSLNVRQNVQFPMREYLDLSPRLLDEVAAAKLKMVGLPPDVGSKMPSELSGGMIKRVALARALALDPADRVPGRADVRPRSHQRGRFRQPDQDVAAYFGADRFHGNP